MTPPQPTYQRALILDALVAADRLSSSIDHLRQDITTIEIATRHVENLHAVPNSDSLHQINQISENTLTFLREKSLMSYGLRVRQQLERAIQSLEHQ